jgi:hypothetical protein
MNHHALTLMILELNRMLDSGDFDAITVDEVLAHIDRGDILQWLKTRITEDFGSDLFEDPSTPYKGFEQFWVKHLQSLLDTSDLARRWGVKNRGLCVLIAWTNEIIQQGSGWKPAEVAGRK